MTETAWRQYHLEFADPTHAEHTFATGIAPGLEEAERTGLLDQWWFMRKNPWKLRVKPSSTGTDPSPGILKTLSGNGRVTWVTGIYESEQSAFGGPEAMAAAHRLFHTDSRFIMSIAASPTTPPHRRRPEVSVLLLHAMMRSAGLDWFEQGDTWRRTGELRPNTTPAQQPLPATVTAMNQLMLADARASTKPGLLLEGREEWISAYEKTGHQLGKLSRQGTLQRGLRSVIAHHIIFHWNRYAIPVTTQTTLAWTGIEAIFGPSI